MASIVQGYEYDIFISYRQKDNKYDGWISEFVTNLRKEIDATFKEDITIYFDENPHDGLLETHVVDKSLESKLKCLIFIPIISKTYCDPKSFAWQNEFCAFNKMANEDHIGRDIKLSNGNVTSRILPVKIHDLNDVDMTLLETELGRVLRPIEFIFKSPGVNRPLNQSDNPDKNQNQTYYRDQINKVANSIQEIIGGIKNLATAAPPVVQDESMPLQANQLPFRKRLITRNVLRASLVYILTAVIIGKALATGSDLLHLKENTIHLITLFLIVLFPIAILTAWFYERSPRGFIRTGSVASLRNPYADQQKKPFTSNILITLLIATIAALFLLFPGFSGKKSVPPNEKSIAVLPFVDLSPGHDKEYFSDGMMEEILNNLYKIGDLKVTSRTSSMQYKGEIKKSAKEIAVELGVANILEGSVRLDKKTVRITVQLIRADTDEHLWSEDYDRDFSDIFSIQSDVAREVAGALKARISPEALRIIDIKPTSNSEAYELFLKGNKLSYYTAKENSEAIALYRKAIELDPGFSSAYEELGFRFIVGATYLSTSQGTDPVKSWQTARPFMEKALEINPDNAQAHQYMAWALLWYEWNFGAAEKQYKEVKRIFPNYSWTDFEVATGHFEAAYEGAVEGVETDSKNANLWQGIIISSYFAGKDPESIIKKALRTRNMKDNIYVRSEAARVYMYLKEYERAISIAKQLIKDFPEVESPRLAAIEAISYLKTTRPDETNRILEELKKKSNETPSGSPSFYTAMIYAVMGNKDLAFEWLEKAYKTHEVEMYWLKVEPPFEPIRSDPRYQTIIDKAGFPK
jgi:TolB-like protein